MNDNERQKLAEKLDEDLENFIASRPKVEYKDGFSEDNWQQEMQLHPAFRTDPIKEGEELPPLIEAMQQLKYDPNENTPEELAKNYKDDGNYNFKLKKYRWAVTSYTEGIKQNCDNAELNAQLYANRATANFYIGNFRSSISDCSEAIKFKNDHMKAILRAAKCCESIKCYEEGFIWCDRGLKIDKKNDTLLKIKSALEKQKTLEERDQRKNRLKEQKLERDKNNLFKIIKEKGIRVDGNSLSTIESCYPGTVNKEVHLNSDGLLVWPVLFLYPEYAQTDFIQEFVENHSFDLHLENMFGQSNERTPWDLEEKYIPNNLQVFFEDRINNVLWEIKVNETLGTVLMHPSCTVRGGTPTFIIAVKSSKFLTKFLKNYDNVMSFGV